VSELELLRARVYRLDMDLLAYGRHLDSCEMAGRRWREKYNGTQLALAARCVCGYHEAIRFKTQGRWPDQSPHPTTDGGPGNEQANR
jgi:hypothetical protein